MLHQHHPLPHLQIHSPLSSTILIYQQFYINGHEKNKKKKTYVRGKLLSLFMGDIGHGTQRYSSHFEWKKRELKGKGTWVLEGRACVCKDRVPRAFCLLLCRDGPWQMPWLGCWSWSTTIVVLHWCLHSDRNFCNFSPTIFHFVSIYSWNWKWEWNMGYQQLTRIPPRIGRRFIFFVFKNNFLY